jgi:membrane protein YdbS with pleckstrin-like domain
VAVEMEPGEGNSPAAWVAVIIMVVAIAAGTFAYWFDVPWLVWSCAGLVVVGALVGVILSKMGYGVKGPRFAPKSHS